MGLTQTKKILIALLFSVISISVLVIVLININTPLRLFNQDNNNLSDQYSANSNATTESNTLTDIPTNLPKTTDSVSSNNEEIVQEEIPFSTVKILLFGDTSLLDPVGARAVQDPINQDPFRFVEDTFEQYDYVVGTLESTIDGESVGYPNPGKAYTFSNPPETATIFSNAGIDAMSYAGNHTKDYTAPSVTHTIDLLNQAGVASFCAGANNEQAYTPLVVDLKGTKVAFLGFNCIEYAFNHATDYEAGTASFSEWKVRESISYAKSQADVVVVFAHWGWEHTQELDPEWQVLWAQIFTDAGADVVIGGHPHVVQPQVEVNGKPVFYSIGNFLFPGMAWDPESQKGIMVEINIDEKKISSINTLKILMDGDGIPSVVENW